MAAMHETYLPSGSLMAGVATLTLLTAPAGPSLAYPRPGETVKMQAAGSAPLSRAPVAVSADARYVAFLGDFGFGCCNVSVYDRQPGTTTSEASANFGGALAISADGRILAYNLYPDVFVRDRQGGFETISVAPDGSPAACDWPGCVKSSIDASLSADGRYVAFMSFASNLVTGDNNQTADVFVRDRQTGITERVSVATDGTQGDGISVEPSISADGRYVAFMSEATTLVPGDINAARDVFVHDRQPGSPSWCRWERRGHKTRAAGHPRSAPTGATSPSRAPLRP
jgi:Tol biopolymer transport system component